MKYRKVFAEMYGIRVDDADKYARHQTLVDILDMRATLRMYTYYNPEEARDILANHIYPWLATLRQLLEKDWTSAIASTGRLGRLLPRIDAAFDGATSHKRKLNEDLPRLA